MFYLLHNIEPTDLKVLQVKRCQELTELTISQFEADSITMLI